MRNPARTASTAAALMIGLALVSAVGVLASGVRATFEHAVDEQFLADYALTSQNGFTPTESPPRLPSVRRPASGRFRGVRGAQGKAFGPQDPGDGVEPNVGDVIKINWIAGGENVAQRLARRRVRRQVVREVAQADSRFAAVRRDADRRAPWR
jgi:putative ABC transport system permease protein